MIVTPIILAGGESRRMGTPKALLDFDGVTCLALVLDTCLRSDATTPVLVLGHHHAKIRAALPAGAVAHVVVNPHHAAGQTSSLKLGLRELSPEADGFLLFPVDLPLVHVSTLNALILAGGVVAGAGASDAGAGATRRAIVLPTHGKKRGHPALFHRSLLSEFTALGDDEPAHIIARRNPDRVLEVPVEDEGVIMRLNTPDDYATALAAYRAGRPSRVR